ncbi:MAG: hypothetical protein JWO45_1846, partial [Spartobacteria bacterium]|nr:hypothetical protein [Spartobacteria bacterium]
MARRYSGPLPDNGLMVAARGETRGRNCDHDIRDAMTTESADFERKIGRIHRLLEEDAVVTWNDRIPDPDNPSQPRQIDITIRRDKKLTAVECRIHKAPQDVNWIEQLIGRRLSLRADAVIAVSASGFTQGAQAKAAQFGVILRDFDALTAGEVRDWGKLRKVRVIFYKFTENVISVTLPILLPRRPTMIDPEGKPFNWRPLFAQVMEQLDERKSIPYGPTTAMPCFLPDVKTQCSFGGMKAIKTTFSTTVRRVIRDVWTSSVVAYADPLDASSRKAMVGALDMGKSEILEAA